MLITSLTSSNKRHNLQLFQNTLKHSHVDVRCGLLRRRCQLRFGKGLGDSNGVIGCHARNFCWNYQTIGPYALTVPPCHILAMLLWNIHVSVDQNASVYGLHVLQCQYLFWMSWRQAKLMSVQRIKIPFMNSFESKLLLLHVVVEANAKVLHVYSFQFCLAWIHVYGITHHWQLVTTASKWCHTLKPLWHHFSLNGIVVVTSVWFCCHRGILRPNIRIPLWNLQKLRFWGLFTYWG